MILRFLQLSLFTILSISIFTGCDKNDDDMIVAPINKPNQLFFGLSGSNQLIKYNANKPETAIATIPIAGLPGGEKIIAIDFRPATGQLYGLGNSRIYIINHETGMATAVGTTTFTPAVSGALVGFDFNPTVDRIRLVTSAGQNLRLNPETGTVAATDININPSASVITSVAYTNNFSGATSTVLFDIDIVAGKLYRQDPPNNGSLIEVGSLGITSSGETAFDISSDNSVALASAVSGSSTNLYSVDINSGKATDLGALATPIIGLAIPTSPVAYAVDNDNYLQILKLSLGGSPITKTITGLQPGETILGIDMRPATGQLYALGSSSRLYTINMSSGAAASVSAAPFATLLSGTSFGFDFNPTVDRIRVISNTGQNLRLNPNDGTIAAVDGALNPGAPAVSAAAYTNNFPGATTTTLYDIDATTDKLYTQAPPNNGTLVEVGPLGIDVAATNGFDIGGTSGRAYMMTTVGGFGVVYSVNLTTGGASLLIAYPVLARAFTVGLGF